VLAFSGTPIRFIVRKTRALGVSFKHKDMINIFSQNRMYYDTEVHDKYKYLRNVSNRRKKDLSILYHTLSKWDADKT
jgi:hypothetical protein